MIPQINFGRTGHLSSRVVFGAAGLGEVSQGTADRFLEVILAAGINHIDTAASYGDSEERIAPWMVKHRAKFFLATKTDERSSDGARASVERSLHRLGVDQIDLLQMHNLVEEDEWRQVHGKDGALEGLLQARAEGLIRFIGVTGHGTRIPRMHLRSLSEFDYDSVLFPYNFSMLSNPSYRQDVEELIEVCTDMSVALQTIKSVARRRWNDDQPDTAPHYSWYEPLRDRAATARAVNYVMGRPSLFLNTSSDYTVLTTIIKAASDPIAVPTEDAMYADVEDLGIRPLFDGGELERI